ncbi:hypothetical protein M6B38_171895 [Iris pallida]|uniref:Uncharacterized protein n=1 Tax=Iris pallida TaxID=29817 RepID=A0AAX6EUD4_IRIPA|nr:hypothetical protein M6B38_171895 [Iris pallida]
MAVLGQNCTKWPRRPETRHSACLVVKNERSSRSRSWDSAKAERRLRRRGTPPNCVSFVPSSLANSASQDPTASICPFAALRPNRAPSSSASVGDAVHQARVQHCVTVDKCSLPPCRP